MAKTSAKIERRIIHAENFSEAEVKGIINLYQELVPGDNTRPIDIGMIVTEAFPKFEEVIGEQAFNKVKSCFGLNGRSSKKFSNDIRNCIAKLKTIENAQYYIFGYKELIKNMAEKLCNAPEGMSDLVKAKLLRVFFVIFVDNEKFVEDYELRWIPRRGFLPFFSQEQALLNNKLIFGPEELFTIYERKLRNSEGLFYGMMVHSLKRVYRDCQEYKNRAKTEIKEVLQFAELRYDGEKGMFTSVNRCIPGINFGEIRKLKDRIHQVRAAYPLEFFCDKKLVTEKIDFSDLYIIHKTFEYYSWKEMTEKKAFVHRTVFGDKRQEYYVVYENFMIADEAEVERWMDLYKYAARYNLELETKGDCEGGFLPKPKVYNVGVWKAVIDYATERGYITDNTRAAYDFEIVDKILALKGAKDVFLRYKRKEIGSDELRLVLCMDEKFERDVLKISVSPVQSSIKFALRNGYAQSEADIDVNLIENVFVPGNEESIKKLANGDIKDSKFRSEIGFEVEFAEAYFNTSKINIKEVEDRLQEIKRGRSEEQIGKSRLLIKLYCYVVENGLGCGAKMKPATRNRGLKPEILKKLIM